MHHSIETRVHYVRTPDMIDCTPIGTLSTDRTREWHVQHRYDQPVYQLRCRLRRSDITVILVLCTIELRIAAGQTMERARCYIYGLL